MSSSFFLDQIPAWTLNAYLIEKCRCDYGCQCNFNDFCRTLVLLHIRSGKYDGANLQEINMVCTFSWPKAIRKGNEGAQLLLQKIQTKNNIHEYNLMALCGSLPRL